MGVNATTNGRLHKTTVEALDRVLRENRALRAANPPKLAPAPFRHCGFCGLPVCGCGLEAYEES